MNVARQNNNVLTKGTTDLITVNRIGNGLKYNGTSNYVALGAPVSLQFSNANNFSISGYVVGLTSSSFYPFAYYSDNSFNGYFISITNTSIYFRYGGTNGSSSYDISATFTNRANCFFTVVKNGTDANNFNIYVDGVLITKTVISNFTPPVSYSAAAAAIGVLIFQAVAGSFAPATLYDLKIFNVAISAGQHTQLYNSFSQDLNGLTSNLVTNWDFNQKQGNTLIDKSTNNINGTLTNFAATSNLGGGAWVNSLGSTITY